MHRTIGDALSFVIFSNGERTAINDLAA